MGSYYLVVMDERESRKRTGHDFPRCRRWRRVWFRSLSGRKSIKYATFFVCLTSGSPVSTGLETLLLGGACATVSFVVGRTVATFAEANMSDLFAMPMTEDLSIQQPPQLDALL